MQHDLPVLVNIMLALVAAFVGGFIARKLKVPTIVGYLLTGVVIGPFTPGFTGDVQTIQQLAELGIVFLLFGVGLHFSLRDLWAVRSIAIPGALLQMTLTTLLGLGLTFLWGWSLAAGVVLGLAISIASTVVLLRNLMDQGLLKTSHGQVAVGWLVMEDLATVLILVLLPTLAENPSEALWQAAGIALLKAGGFAILMLVAGTRIIPWMLTHLAHLRSRELFIIAIVIITVGIALGASSLFGVSLALGAFLAGIVVSESSLSHQVEAEVLPFRETFAVLFFVSVGMLVNPSYLFNHLGEVLALVALIVLGKFVVTLLLGCFFPLPARTVLVIAIGLSQIGEFSFILGQAGVALHILTQDQYSLLLAGALLSITINPLIFRALPWMEARLRAMPAFWARLDRREVVLSPVEAELQDHVVVIGYGRVGRNIINVLKDLDVPHLVIELDMGRAIELEQQGVLTLYGDAANSDILAHAHVDLAQAIVVTIPDEAAAKIVVATARECAPQVPIVVRAATQDGVAQLFALGATNVIHPELEGGLTMVQQTLMLLDYPEGDIQNYTEVVRREHYDLSTLSAAEQQALTQMRASPQRELRLVWFSIPARSGLVGQALEAANATGQAGATIVLVKRNEQLITNPDSSLVLQADDQLGIVGEVAQIARSVRILGEEETLPQR
jgi:CPA2 family monovalent cation:H+ antiporter-2